MYTQLEAATINHLHIPQLHAALTFGCSKCTTMKSGMKAQVSLETTYDRIEGADKEYSRRKQHGRGHATIIIARYFKLRWLITVK